ncbi:MAG: recombination-associated protein RdgC [Pseudomonadales bacterium]|nr:recombination-associated protein RdgC [Pseudomonadales bacterium]
MLFTNAFVFRMTRAITLNEDELESALSAHQFVPCRGIRPSSFGWISPVALEQDQEDAPLQHTVAGCHLLCARREDKVVPASAVAEQVTERVSRVEQVEGRKLSTQERQNIKDDAFASLLPQALPRSKQILGYLSPADQLLIVGTSSRPEAEMFLNTLRVSLGSLPVVPPPVRSNPGDYYTRWLTTRELPDQFTLGDQCDLTDPEEGSSVNCRRQDLATLEVRNHVESGKVCTRLGLIWRGELRFVVDRDLAIKQMKFLDAAEIHDDEDPIAKLDADLSQLALTLKQMLPDLYNALGGEARFSEDDFKLSDEAGA